MTQDLITDPVLIKTEPRWKPPVALATCPSCGYRANRRASSWAYRVDGTLSARFFCGGGAEECWRIWDIQVVAP